MMEKNGQQDELIENKRMVLKNKWKITIKSR